VRRTSCTPGIYATERNKDGIQNWQLCSVWMFQLWHHRVIKLKRRFVFTLAIRISIPLFCLLPPVNGNPGCLNFSTSSSVLLLTCRVHWLGFLERHNTSVALVLIFLSAYSHAENKRSRACWRPCSEDASSTKSSTKSKRLIRQLTTVTHSSTQLWQSIQFM